MAMISFIFEPDENFSRRAVSQILEERSAGDDHPVAPFFSTFIRSLMPKRLDV
jgi:hypothetical protein